MFMPNKKISTMFAVVIIVVAVSISLVFIIRANTSTSKAIYERNQSEMQLGEINQKAINYANQLIQEAHVIDERKIEILMERGYNRNEAELLSKDNEKMREEQIKILMEAGYSRSKAEELLAADSK
jgi:predicted Ser/Thr protein kinase